MLGLDALEALDAPADRRRQRKRVVAVQVLREQREEGRVLEARGDVAGGQMEGRRVGREKSPERDGQPRPLVLREARRPGEA